MNTPWKMTRHALLIVALSLCLPSLAFSQDAELQATNAALELTVEPVEAQDQAADTPENTDAENTDEQPATPPAPAPEPGVLKFHLMDGTIITGKLTAETLPVSTAFGELTVPIEAIVSFAPGLESHPKLNQRITSLIAQLAAPEAKARDDAQAQLLTFGQDLLPELEEYADDADAERKVRVATITEELLAIEPDEFGIEQGPSVSLARLDQIVTERFTIAGKIEQNTFTIASKFGELTVNLADIKAVEQQRTDKPEIRRTVDVSGTNMTCLAYKKTGIRVNRGDRVIISAEGQITMSPWGSNSVSTPDGVPQNGMYTGQIPMGALAGRIGDSGEEMMIGSKNSFVASKSGTLQLGFAMQQNWSNYQFPGTYKVRIRVVPAQ